MSGGVRSARVRESATCAADPVPGRHLFVASSKRVRLPGTTVTQLSANEFDDANKTADAVITHACVGSIMNLFDVGISPVVSPRRAIREEHVVVTRAR